MPDENEFEMSDEAVEAAVGVQEAPVVPAEVGRGIAKMEAMNAIIADAMRDPGAYVEAFKVEGGGE